MLLLVNGATTTVYGMKDKQQLGVLFSPGCGNSITRAVESGLPWACDNGAFSGFDKPAYKAMVERCLPYVRRGLRWIACPDVVGDHDATLDLFDRWGMYLRRRGLPIAFVCQDGCTVGHVPWGDIEAIFIGGTTEWKLSAEAASLIRIARMKAMWVHVGRVNTRRRIRWCFDQDVTSVDGTSMSRFAERYLPKFTAYIAGLKKQEHLYNGQPRGVLYPSSTRVASPGIPHDVMHITR